MKRIVCLVVVACLIPVCSFAVDISRFNDNAMYLGEEAIDESSVSKFGDSFLCTIGNIKIMFDEDGNRIKRVTVQGDGTSFLSYAMAAIMVFDNRTATFADNAGKLFSSYLLAKTNGLQSAFISTGEFFIINPVDGEFYFTVGK